MAEDILVIDDDPAVRKAFLLALEDSKYQVDAAESGESGISLLTKKDYGMIFLDLKMPGMNGAETLRALRKINRNIPVYIVTAFHKEFLEDLQSLRQEGIKFELLRKPLGGDEILMIANSVLNKPVAY
ncbi:MAG: response regulator [Gammaproteobacteria bacterium]|nr:response regulator [Gammaproteobacteria bacterium]